MPKLTKAISTAAAAAVASEDAEAGPFGELAKLKGIKTRLAHHGSPHDFDKFSMSKIGTGEGAQAYGHGLYFSSSEDIAKHYRDALTMNKNAPDWSVVKGEALKNKLSERFWEMRGQGIDATPTDTIDDVWFRLDQQRAQALKANDAEWFDQVASQQAELARLRKDPPKFAKGKLYQVEIPDESMMLNWDKPLSEQPEGVRKALEPIVQRSIDEEFTTLKDAGSANGSDAYAALTDMATNWQTGSNIPHEQTQAAASAWLRERGIPGITYKGGSSGERNFVVFDDELVNTVEKGFATPETMLAAAATGAATEFARRRSAKNGFWGEVKGIGEAGRTLAQGLVGGVAGDLSALGGYINPFRDVEDVQQSSSAISAQLSHAPSDDARKYLEPIISAFDTFGEDIQRGHESALDNSMIYRGVNDAYGRLPERAKGIIESIGNLAL